MNGRIDNIASLSLNELDNIESLLQESNTANQEENDLRKTSSFDRGM